MEKKITTLKDIAKELKVSIATVSRALQNKAEISVQTKRRVKAMARKLNYQPNLLAQSLLNKRTNTIGVVVPEIKSHFFASIIMGFKDVLRPLNYNLMVCQSEESYKDEVKIFENLLRVQVDGILVSPSSATTKFDHFLNLQKKGIPVVVFDRDSLGFETDKVLVDDYMGAFQAVDYLIQSGCKRVAHLAGPHKLSTTKHRLEGYVDALKKNNIPYDEAYIEHVKGFSHDDGLKPAKNLMKLNPQPDAIFAINDCIAISAMHVVKKLNLHIPDQVSIVGFDDEPHSKYFTPALSTVWQPVYSIGILAAKILLKQLQAETLEPPFRKEIFTPELLIRASSKKI